jgi:hypothetical protein
MSIIGPGHGRRAGVATGTAADLTPWGRFKETLFSLAVAVTVFPFFCLLFAIVLTGLLDAVGLVDAWGSILQVTASSLDAAAPLTDRVTASLGLGVLAGLTTGVVNAIWRRVVVNEATIEAATSLDGINSFRLGAGCVALHVCVSIVVAVIAAWLPFAHPAFSSVVAHLGLSGDDVSNVVYFVVACGSGGGPPPEFKALDFAGIILTLYLIAGIIAAVFMCEIFTLTAWILSPAVAAAIDGAATGASFSGARAVIAYVLRFNARGVNAGRQNYIWASGAEAAFHGAAAGALNGAIYALIVYLVATFSSIQMIMIDPWASVPDNGAAPAPVDPAP